MFDLHTAVLRFRGPYAIALRSRLHPTRRVAFKPPNLRDLAVRAPFYHAGAAPDLQHLVNYYNLRFAIGLTAQEKADLVNFLNAL
jgi:cytochrome c peroxidase